MPIRLATKQDLPQLQSLIDKLNNTRDSHFSKTTKPFHKRVKPHTKLSANDLKKNIIFVSEEKNVITGYVIGTLHKRPSHTLSTLAYIDELYVDEPFRKTGTAKKLLKQLQKEFKARGCDHMTTKTDEENSVAQQFYASIGMKRTTIELWKKL